MHRSMIYSSLISENCLILKILVASIQHCYIRQGESASGSTMWKVTSMESKLWEDISIKGFDKC